MIEFSSEELIVRALDIASGWVSPGQKTTCDCHTKSPTYPVARENYHVEPCPWFYVERLAERVRELEGAIQPPSQQRTKGR